ncbi:MAG: Gfo/Idh/MocA family oxidoreductase [Candidatus Atribacteria bacterium]|nr:Gfo/Idh/MocA family oxidoreductase [Candidatus Atribacteria bacterium]
MVNKKIKAGVIGTGAIAHVAYFPSLASMKNVEISAVLSGHFENAQSTIRQYGGGRAVHNLDEFLKQDLDCAFILTPKNVRKEYLVPLLDAKLDVLVEKPLATTLKECAYLADISAKSGQLVMVAFNRRFSPVNQRGIAAFNGEKPEYVLAQKNREFKEYRGTLENAIHMVDMLRYILGECTKVEAQARYKDPFYEDLCTALLSFESGSVGLLGASRSSGQWFERIEMYGGNKTVIMECPVSYRVIYPDHEEGQNMTPLYKGWANVIDTLGFKPCIEHFIHCVETREKPLTCAEDAFKTHELMDRILRVAGLPDLSNDWSGQK